MYIRSRREFLQGTLRSAAALGAVGALSKFGEMNALAAGSSNYQALVCIFLAGGNDGHNTVVPHRHRAAELQPVPAGARRAGDSPGSLLPIANGSDSYGLHPSLPEIQSLYNQGKAAVLANVGMLVQPITRDRVPDQQQRDRSVHAVLALRSEQPVADRHSHRHWQLRLGRPHRGSHATAEFGCDFPAALPRPPAANCSARASDLPRLGSSRYAACPRSNDLLGIGVRSRRECSNC